MSFDNIIDKCFFIVEKDELFNKYIEKSNGFQLFKNDSVTYFSNKRDGILFIFNELKVLTTIHFYGQGHIEYSSFIDELPISINLSKTFEEVTAKFEKYEIKRGGGGILPVLEKSNIWIMYLIEGNCYRFEFKDKNIYLVTLSNLYKDISTDKK